MILSFMICSVVWYVVQREENKKVIVEMTLRPVLALQNKQIGVQALLKASSSVIFVLV